MTTTANHNIYDISMSSIIYIYI